MRSSSNVETFHPRYLAAFKELNLEWIETHFSVEKTDLEQLENPERAILSPGGEIFFVLDEGTPVGTCALIPHGPSCFELSKMAVDPKYRGRGYGDLLIEAAIDWARRHHASKVLLLSNTVLEPAISLYRKHGFTECGTSHDDYLRCNIQMELSL